MMLVTQSAETQPRKNPSCSQNLPLKLSLLDGQDIAALMVERAAARDCPRYSGGTYSKYEDTRHLALPIGEFCWP